MAKLYFRFGAMNSGKSTSMLQAAYNYEERGQHVLLAKPVIDTKGDRDIVSRLGVRRPVDFLLEPDADVWQEFGIHRERVLLEKGGPTACLLVDEAQFLRESQVDDLLRIAILQDVPVIAYGIRTDFQTVAFPGSRRLLEIAHSLEEMRPSAAAVARPSSTRARSASGSSSPATRSRSTARTSRTCRSAAPATSRRAGECSRAAGPSRRARRPSATARIPTRTSPDPPRSPGGAVRQSRR